MYSYQRNIKLGRMQALPIDAIGDNSVERVEQARHGGKLILPNSVLQRVFRSDRSLLIFKLINEKQKRQVFCGVFTFDGEEDKVLIPLWMFKQLAIESGDDVLLECVTGAIQKGMFVKFEPLTRAFLQITDPKTVLEHCLRSYVCLSREDVISIYYNRNVYELRVCETLPSDTVIINECDLTVDFEPMKSCPEELPPECDLDQIQSSAANEATDKFQAFTGTGQSTGGTKVNAQRQTNNEGKVDEVRTDRQSPMRPIGIADYHYQLGSIFFKRHKSDLMTIEQNQEQKEKENHEWSDVRSRRPVTRSQTQPFRSQSSQTLSNISDSKRRKTN